MRSRLTCGREEVHQNVNCGAMGADIFGHRSLKHWHRDCFSAKTTESSHGQKSDETPPQRPLSGIGRRPLTRRSPRPPHSQFINTEAMRVDQCFSILTTQATSAPRGGGLKAANYQRSCTLQTASSVTVFMPLRLT